MNQNSEECMFRDPDYPDLNCGIRMHWSVIVGTKWQVVIPSDVRRTLAINPGDSMCVLTKHGKAIAMIKMDDLDEFMAFMREEMSAIKAMTLEQAKRNQPTTPITQP